MAENRIFYKELKNTSNKCKIEDLKKDLLNSNPINNSEKEFQNLIADLHKDENTYTESAKLTMMYVQVKDLPTEEKLTEEKNKMNILFFRAELAVNGNKRSLAENSIRKHVEWITVKDIAESVEPGIISKMIACLPDTGFWDTCKRSTLGGWVIYVCSKYIHVLNLYLDFIRDCLLFTGLVRMISAWSFLDPCFFTEFSHQLLWLLLFSIICPVMTSAVNVARNPSIFFGSESYEDNPSALMKWTFLPFGLVLCPLIPGFLTNARDVEKENTKQLLQKSQSTPEELEEIHKRILFRKKIDKKILDFKEVELIVEVTIQSMIQLIMILMNQSYTRTEEGLDNAFKVGEPGFFDNTGSESLNNTGTENLNLERTIETSSGSQPASLNNTTLVMLIVSLLWSLKTALTTYTKLHAEQQRSFLRTKSKVIVGLRGFTAFLNTIGSYLVFFSTVLGLFNLMGHYNSEAALFAVPINTLTKERMDESIPIASLSNYSDKIDYPFGDVYRYLTVGSEKRDGRIGFDSLDSRNCCPKNFTANPDGGCSDREEDAKYCDGLCPRPNIYTMISLGWTYALFMGIIAVQFWVLFVTKHFTSKKFTEAKLLVKLWHSLKCMLFSDAFCGWDEDLDDDIEQLKGKFAESKWEITVGCFINCFFIVLKVLPIPVAAFHAYERQILMQDTLGTIVDEDQSILLLYLFMIFYIPAACLISLAEWKMMMVYLDKFHPWINILAVEDNEDHAAPDREDSAIDSLTMNNADTTGHETSSNDSIQAVNEEIKTIFDADSVEENGRSDDRSSKNALTLKKEV